MQSGCEYVVMTPETLTMLETQYAETWRLARGRLAERGVTVITI